MEKVCCRCKIKKSISYFYKDQTHKDGLSSCCKQCRAVYDKIYYKNLDKAIKYNRNKNRTVRIRGWVKTYKQTLSCEHCGISDFRVLDFHHPNDDKEFNIANATQCKYSLIRIKAEIAKCICLCANCHRIITYEERQLKYNKEQ